MITPFHITYIVSGIIILGVAVTILKIVAFPVNIGAAEHYLKKGKTNRAKKMAQRILKKNPKDYNAHFLYAKCLLKEKNRQIALTELNEVNRIGIFSKFCPETEFREIYAKLLMDFDKMYKSLEQYILLLQNYPNNPLYTFEAAKLFELHKSYKRAMELYMQTIKLDSNHEEAYLRLGIIFFNKSQYRDAENIFNKVLSIQPENSSASYWMGLVCKQKNNFNKAIQLLEPALRNPDYKINALIERGECFLKTDNVYSAIPELERAERLLKDDNNNDHLKVWYLLGNAYEKDKKYEQAITIWKKIFKVNKEYKDVAARLDQYHQLRTEDRIKDYITASKTEFMNLCKALCRAQELEPIDFFDISAGFEATAIEIDKKKNTSKSQKLIWFLRASEPITESTVRSFHARLKSYNYTNGIIFSSSKFTTQAQQFACTRTIDLVSPNKLKTYLDEV